MFGLGTSVVPHRLCSGGRRTRALVCAPSNSALDEIVLRLLTAGLRGPSGDVYRPTVVRVGVQVCAAAAPIRGSHCCFGTGVAIFPEDCH